MLYFLHIILNSNHRVQTLIMQQLLNNNSRVTATEIITPLPRTLIVALLLEERDNVNHLRETRDGHFVLH
jgi:hypothetical protein